MRSTADQEKFLTTLEENKGIIYKVANSYCKCAEDRKDLVQEIIIQLWKSFEKYSAGYKYSTWMYRIALNTAISFYRKEGQRDRVSNQLAGNILFVEEEDSAGIEENLAMLRQFIGGLRDLDKALMLLYLEEKSHKEIAEIMGLSETNVGTRVARIKDILKQKFSNIKIST